MYPEIFHLSFLHTYGVLVALAFLAGLWMAARLARRDSLDVDAVTNLGIYCALAAIAGAKLMMLIVDPRYRENPREIFTLDTLQAGGVFYGGLLAALAVSWWYMRKTRLPLWRTADVFAPAIALGHGIGRLGCFSAGCCWGVECHSAVGRDVPQPGGARPGGRAAGRSRCIPRSFTKAAAEFAIFAVLYRRIGRAHGRARSSACT